MVMSRPTAKRRPVSLDAVDIRSSQLRSVRSPRSLEALRRLGLELQDLVYVSLDQFLGDGKRSEAREEMYRLHEDLRVRRLTAALAERSKLLNSSTPPSHSSPQSSSSLTHMQLHEQRRLRRLEHHKAQELLRSLVLPSACRHSTPVNPTIHPKSERPTPVFRRQKVAKRPLIEKKIALNPGNDQEKEGKNRENSDLLASLKAKLEARALAITQSKTTKPTLATHSSTPTHLRTSRTPSERNYSLEIKERKRNSALKAISSRFEQKKQEKELFWTLKMKYIREMEVSEQKKTEKERKKLISQQKKAVLRLEEIEKEREKSINLRISQEKVKFERSKLKKSLLEHENANWAEKEVEKYSILEQKSEENRLEKVENLRKTSEIREFQRNLRRSEALRLRKIEDYRRKEIEEKLTEENEHIKRLKDLKNRELLQKQRIKKQFEVQKQQISDRLERFSMLKDGKRQSKALFVYTNSVDI